MPVATKRMDIILVLQDLEDLWSLWQALDMWMVMNIAPARGEFKLLIRRDILVAEKNYSII